jgi:hypothetical protein
VGTSPSAVAVGDFNRDGQKDVAVVNSGSNNVSVLLGNGSGGFTIGPNSPIATSASNPIDIAAGDLDRDGILDLVVAFGSVSQAQILRGLGGAQAGQFSAVAPFDLTAAPTRLPRRFSTRTPTSSSFPDRCGSCATRATGVAGVPLSTIDLLPLPGGTLGAATLNSADGKSTRGRRATDVAASLARHGRPGPASSGVRTARGGRRRQPRWLADLVTANSATGDASVLETPAA